MAVLFSLFKKRKICSDDWGESIMDWTEIMKKKGGNEGLCDHTLFGGPAVPRAHIHHIVFWDSFFPLFFLPFFPHYILD